MTDELTRLRAENERLLAANRDVMLHWNVLRDDYERLREMLGEAIEYADQDYLTRAGEVMVGRWRAALAAQPAPSPWRPIETAPKDGTEVLMVFVFDYGEALHRVVRWDGSEMWPWRDEYTGYREQEAKGWMPLLPVPGKEEA